MPDIQAQAFKQLLRNHRRRMTRVQRSRPIKVFAPPYPMAIERQFQRELTKHFTKIAGMLFKFVTKENYDRWVADYKRNDHLDSNDLHTDAYGDEINRVIGTLRTGIDEFDKNDRELNGDLNKTVNAEYVYSKGQWVNLTTMLLGHGYSTDEAWWNKTRKAWLNENITLIKSQPEEYLKKISDTLYRGVRHGWMWGDMADELKKINTSMTDKKASLIARDQVGKLNGQLTKYRQTDIGLNYYVWTAIEDEKECDICKQIDGALCSWDDDTIMSWDNGKTWIKRPIELQGTFPGQAHPVCRCQALAYFGDVINDVDSDIDGQEDEINTDHLDSGGSEMKIPDRFAFTKENTKVRGAKKKTYVHGSPRQRVDAIKKRQKELSLSDVDNNSKVTEYDTLDPETTAGQTKRLLAPGPDTPDDTNINDDILNKATEYVYATAKINTKFDVPYLAGYNADGSIIYIDRDLPQFMRQGAKKMDVWKFTTNHERDEISIEAGIKGIEYQWAHQEALQLERRKVMAAGFDWQQYSDFCDKYIKFSWHKSLTKLPPDLDLKPYKDEHDLATLKEMQSLQAQGKEGNVGPSIVVHDSDEGSWVTINGNHVLIGSSEHEKIENNIIKVAAKKFKAGSTETAIAANKMQLQKIADTHIVKNFHEQDTLNFELFDYSKFKAGELNERVLVHSSPASTYYVARINGRPAYVRVSNHWGEFKTNIIDEKEPMGSPFRVIGRRSHNWTLKNALPTYSYPGAPAKIQVGYIYLDKQTKKDSYREDEYENEINKIIMGFNLEEEQVFNDPADPLKGTIQKAMVGTYLHSKGQWVLREQPPAIKAQK